jgi:hypothetical protein
VPVTGSDPRLFKPKLLPVTKLVRPFFGLSILDLFVLRFVNWKENRRRDRLEEAGQAPEQPEDAAARDMTDKEQPSFRYML